MPKKSLIPPKTESPNPCILPEIHEAISLMPFHKPFTMSEPMPRIVSGSSLILLIIASHRPCAASFPFAVSCAFKSTTFCTACRNKLHILPGNCVTKSIMLLRKLEPASTALFFKFVANSPALAVVLFHHSPTRPGSSLK